MSSLIEKPAIATAVTALGLAIGLEYFIPGNEFTIIITGVLAPLIVKQILIPVDGQLVISLPILMGCLSTAIVIKKIKMFLPSVLFGAIIGLITRYFFT